MAKYLVTFENNPEDCIRVAQSRDDVDSIIRQWKEDGCMIDGDMPVVYQLGKKMTASIETVIKLKGE